MLVSDVATSLVAMAWHVIELAVDALMIALRFLFGDPRPVVAGATFHPLDPDRGHP